MKSAGWKRVDLAMDGELSNIRWGFTMEQIQLIGDAVAVCMCAVTVLYLVKQRAKCRRHVPVRGLAGIVRNFNQEFRQFVGAGRAPLKTLCKLEGMEGAGAEHVPGNDDPMVRTVPEPLQDTGDDREGRHDSSDASTGDRYGEVKRLADIGLDREAIFERVGLPRGEIELVLKVNRMRSGARENVRSGNSFVV
jgi:hypothetical protein